MIAESHPWREEIGRAADRFDAWSKVVDWEDEMVAFEIERDVMVTAYALRKLLEAHKLADSTANSRVTVEAMPLIDEVPDYMNWHRIDEFYDFEQATPEQLSLKSLCNQVIHSFIFTFCIDGDLDEECGLAGFLVASDHVRSSKLYRVDIEIWTGLLRQVERENIVATHIERKGLGKVEVSNFTADEVRRARLTPIADGDSL